MDDRNLPPPRVIHRVLGVAAATDRIGAGVMDKSGVAHDQVDSLAPTWSVVYVLRGRGRYRDAQGRTVDLGPGDCFQRIPGRPQSTVLDPASGWREAFVDLGVGVWQMLDRLRMLPPEPPAWHWGLTPARIARFTTLINELAVAGERELPELCIRCQALAVEALRAAAPPSAGTGGDVLDRCCRLLAEAADGRVDLRSFCRREGLDFERFRKDFTKRIGQSPGQYRIRRRIERACGLLEATADPVTAIAGQLGYASPYEFSAQFRQWMGVSPQSYRGRRSRAVCG